MKKRMTRVQSILNSAVLVLSASLLGAQTTTAPDPAPPAPAPAAVPSWSAGEIDFSGLIDAYYSYNSNHPASRTNQLRNFDTSANQFSLNMAKFVMEHQADPVGFRIDLGFGKAMEILHGAEQGPEVFRNIMQAYVSVKPGNMKGLQIDFGKFFTSAGAELTESHSNFNYSRSLLFAWAAPYYHFGARATMPLHKNFSAGVALVNGWNNVDDNNSGKTVGLTGTISGSKAAWTNTYYFGPEKTGTNTGMRHLWDSALTVNPNSKTSMYVNFDYGTDRRVGGGSDVWYGIGTAVRYQANDWFALAPRIEYFNDRDGWATGTVQKLKEFTMTAEFKMKEGFLLRPEYRRDWSDQPFFDRGQNPGVYRSQNTLLVAFIAYFGPRR